MAAISVVSPGDNLTGFKVQSAGRHRDSRSERSTRSKRIKLIRGHCSTLQKASHSHDPFDESSLRSSTFCLTSCRSCRDYSLPALSTEEAAEMRTYVGMDCEFVGVGVRNTNGLGRCSIVDYRGVVLYDKFVKPPEPVVDYRSPWSGLHAIHIAQGIPFVVAQQQISNILQGKVVVGHAVHNDFKVIGIRHPEMNVRDTVKCRLLRERSELPGPAVALRRLAKTLLGW